MLSRHHILRPARAGIAVVALAAAIGGAAPSLAATAAKYHPVKLASLEVTDGTVTPAAKNHTLRTRSAGMRATHVRARHRSDARLWFRFQGDSDTTKPLGSGIVRRQIGLKLRAQDPCNLVYVMWRRFPDKAIAIYVKRNPGQTTSAQCGNRGYTTVATIPLTGAATVDRSHTLEVRTRRNADSGLALSIHVDGRLFRDQALSPALTTGLEGPIGVRSDNGHYLFRLSGRRR